MILQGIAVWYFMSLPHAEARRTFDTILRLSVKNPRLEKAIEMHNLSQRKVGLAIYGMFVIKKSTIMTVSD